MGAVRGGSDDGLLLVRAFQEVASQIDDALVREHDLCLTWFEVMVELQRAADPIRVADLASRVTISQPRVSRVLQAMSDRGMVDRRVAPHDARGTEVSLTTRGRAAFERARSTYDSMLDAAVRDRLNPAQMANLREIAARLGALTTADA